MRLAVIRRGASAALALLVVLTTLAWAGAAPVAASSKAGAVYVLTNQVAGNEVAIFTRDWKGMLTPAGAVSAGGVGTGGGLGSQGAVILSQDKRWLFAVNAGSNSIAAFAVTSSGLRLTDTIDSGGLRPVSLTFNRNLLYVLNVGGDGNISGFRVSPRGDLTALANSTRPLSSTTSGAAQVEFSPDGRLLAVTEKATNTIDTYVVGTNGLTTGPVGHVSNGGTPYGFAFTRHNRLVVSEASAGAVSSYQASATGGLAVISGSATTHQAAPCWVVVTANGRYAYTTNAGSGSISGYRIRADGSLHELNADGRTGVTGAGTTPTDMSIERQGKYLYVLESAAHKVGVFEIHTNGSLSLVQMDGVLPVGAVGIAAS